MERTHAMNPHRAELERWASENIPETAGFYILHFETPIGTEFESFHGQADHYCGSAANLRSRFLTHLSGHGARLTEVANERGSKYYMVKVYQTETVDDARAYEAYYKKCAKNGRRHCPYCGGNELPTPRAKTLQA